MYYLIMKFNAFTINMELKKLSEYLYLFTLYRRNVCSNVSAKCRKKKELILIGILMFIIRSIFKKKSFHSD